MDNMEVNGGRARRTEEVESQMESVVGAGIVWREHQIAWLLRNLELGVGSGDGRARVGGRFRACASMRY